MDYELGENTEEDNEIKNIQDLILTCRVKLLNYAIKWNYSFSRWQKIVTMMILKEMGNIMIHRMRMIHLYLRQFVCFIHVQLTVHFLFAL